jgi:SAM-dependent methyltransferase
MDIAEYHKMAAVEDEMWYYHALHAHVLHCLQRHLSESPVALLDAGCGTGGLIKYLQARMPAWPMTGVDLSPLACEFARERTAVKIHESNLTDLPFKEAEFGAVVSTDVLYHIDDDAQALTELVRIMRPGAVMVINVPAYQWLWSYHDVAVHSRRRYGRAELRAKLVAAGLEPLQITHWNMLLLPLIVLRRKLLPAPAGGSDVESYAVWSNALLKGVMAFESGLLRLFGGLPAGSSLLAVARKPV